MDRKEFFNYKPWHVLLKIKELLMISLNCVLDPEYSLVVHQLRVMEV